MFNWNNGGYPYTQNYNTAQPQQQGNNSIVWVQGREGAKSYLLGGPNQSALLMDSESNCFYIKSTDASGMPMPLRTFDYVERTQKQEIPQADYITREEFDKVIAEIRDAKQSIPTA